MASVPKEPSTSTSAYYQSSSLTDPFDRFANSGAPSHALNGVDASTSRYSRLENEKRTSAGGSRWNPRSWRRRTWIGVGVAAVAVVVIVAVGAYEGVRANRYPDYTTLSYTLSDTYSGEDFFDNFDYFVGYDPSSGFVHYSNEAQCQEMNLTYASASTSVLRVDNTEANATTGRHSARITSKTTYGANSLFVFDIAHSPYGCATWPAIWLTDPSDWPLHGEIDVVEAVNQATNGNQVTLHTTEGCSMKDVKRKQTGTTLTTNCYNGTDSNAGCGVSGPADTYGEAFNTNGGGIYAMELRDAGIRVWFFARDDIPTDLSSSSSNTTTTTTTPNPETWPTPLADFPNTSCDIATHFSNQSIIVDIDVCGSWAGATSVYETEDQCPGTCVTYAAENPSAFDEAYWAFNSFHVYTAAS